jgi:hypothetical protein
MAGIKLYIGLDSRGLKKGLSDNGRLISRWANRMASRLASAGMRMGRAITRGMITSIKRLGFVAGGLIAGGIVKSVKEAARFEDYGVQFEALLGSADAAKKRMDEIKQVDLNVPFDITSIADASRILQVFTNGAFASTEALTMMADAAAVTPNDIKDVAFWYGRAYSMIQSGRPFGEAAMRLQEMGLLSGDARNEMERLGKTKGPARIEKMMAMLNGEMLKFAGAAAKRAKTFNGIWSIFTSATKQAFAAVGEAILPLAKDWLVELIDKINELRDDGTLYRWGMNVSDALQAARAGIENFIPRLKELWKEFQTFVQDPTKTIEQKISSAISKGITTGVDTVAQNKAALADIGKAIASGIVDGLSDGITNVLGGEETQKKIRPNIPMGGVVGAMADIAGSKGQGLSVADQVKKELKLWGETIKLSYNIMDPTTGLRKGYDFMSNRMGDNKNGPIRVIIETDETKREASLS